MALVCQSLWTYTCCKHTWPSSATAPYFKLSERQAVAEQTHLWAPRHGHLPLGPEELV